MGLNKHGKPRFKKNAPPKPVAKIEDDFQTRRRMFAFVDGVLHVADAGDRRSHAQWFAEAGFCGWTDNRAFDQIVRGFYLDGRLFAYRGHNFDVDGMVINTVEDNLEQLVTAFDLQPDVRVLVGAIPGHDGPSWRGRMQLGTVAQLQE